MEFTWSSHGVHLDRKSIDFKDNINSLKKQKHPSSDVYVAFQHGLLGLMKKFKKETKNQANAAASDIDFTDLG